MSDQSITQLNCVPERFHCQRALCDSGQSEEIRYRSECENKMVVIERVRVPIESMRNKNLFSLGVDLVHIATEKIHVANHFANRINDVCQIQIARGDLVQHRSKEKKVLAINDRDLKARIIALLEFQRGIKSAEAAAENEDTRLVCHFRLVEQALESLQKSERSTAALQDANLGVKLLSKNAPFKPEQFAERPCLEWTAARCVRRFGVTNFRDVTQPRMIEMLVERWKKLRAGLFSRGSVSAMHAHPGFDERANQPRPNRAPMINGVSRTGIALIVWSVAGFGWRERAQTERGEQKNFDSID